MIFLGAYLIAGGTIAGAGDVGTIVGAYVVAWLAGLLTPGAPAGLGVREAVLLAVLRSMAPGPTILLAVLIGRVATVLGDLGFYLFGRIVGSKR